MIDYLIQRRRVIVFAIVVMAITMIPYLVGFAQQGEEWRFTGFVIGVEDGNSYIAKMLSGATGSWLFRSPHSAAEQQGVIAYLPYILLGKLSSAPAQHDQLVVIYHLARFIFGFMAILATYDFISIFIKRENLKGWALALITLGGGLGWILVVISQKGIFGSLPLEFISPESFGFLGIFGFPHLAAARAFFLWGLTLFLSRENGILAGIFWLIMGFFQPMIVVLAWAVICIYLAAVILTKYIDTKKSFGVDNDTTKKMLFKVMQAVLFSAPIVIYTAYIFLIDPYFKAWAAQNRFSSPHLAHYIIAYGLVLPLSITGISNFIKDQKQDALLLAGWLVISPILIYAPVIAQRRLAEGIWAVLIIGLVGNYSNRKKIPRVVKGLLLLLIPSTLFIFLGSILSTIKPSEPLFRRIDEVSVYEFITEAAEKNAVVLSSFEIGNNLPAWTPARAVMGHGPETIGLEKIKSDISAYFSQVDSTWDCWKIFTEYDANYLFWGPIEKKNWKRDPGKFECLLQIYNKGDYSIFEVRYQD